MEIRTTSAQDTKNLGKKIGNQLIQTSRGISAKIITLSGELGSGKTTFVQGLGSALGILDRVLSPTFILSREYPLNLKLYSHFYHIDLYRIQKTADSESLGLTEIFKNPQNLVCIEWPEQLGTHLPKDHIAITFTYANDTDRLITIKGLTK